MPYRLEALRLRDGRVFEHWALGPVVPSLSSFGQNDRGELYALSLSGNLFRLARRERVRSRDPRAR